jgi:Flp pilus assembly protein TadB
MSFSDPFNRVSCKRDKEFHAFQEQLRLAGIDTEEKARAVLHKSRKSMLGISATIVIMTLVIVLIWPQLIGITAVFSCLLLLWLFITMTRGQKMMKQFIQQEF